MGSERCIRDSYVGIIDRWTKAFGADQVFVGFFEDVVARPVELLEEILEFIGVTERDEGVVEGASRKVRPGVKVEMPDAVRDFLIERNKDGMRVLAERYGSPVDQWIDRYLGGEQEGPRA